MKKLTAMLLSLVMCFSLLAIPAQAAVDPDNGDTGVIDVGGGFTDPDGNDPDEPEDPAPDRTLPYPRDSIPTRD